MTDVSPTPQGGSSWKRRALLVAKWLLFVALVYFVGRELLTRIRAVDWASLTIDPLTLALALLSVLVAKAMFFAPYGLLLDRLWPRRPPWRVVAAVVWVSQLGKYLPGKIGSVAGMAYLFNRRGVSAKLMVSIILLVTGLAVAIGMAVAVPVSLTEPLRGRVPLAWLWFLLGLAAALVGLHPRLFAAVGNFALKRAGFAPLSALHGWRDYAGPVLALLVHYGLLGLGMWLMARAMTPVGPELLPLFCCVVVVAIVGGLLVVIAPAGLGVQEGIIMLILTPVFPDNPEVIPLVVVLMRLAQTVAELVLAGLGGIVLRHARLAVDLPAASTPEPRDPAASA